MEIDVIIPLYKPGKELFTLLDKLDSQSVPVHEVIQAIEDQAKKADYDTLSKVFNSAIGDIYTSLDSKDILDLLANITKYRIVDEGGFPEETMRATGNIGAKGSSVVPMDLESNVVWLHQFLFDDANYTVTDSVKEYSRKIASDTAPYLNK